DVRRFAEEGGALSSEEPVQKHERLMAETQGRGGASAVSWSASGEMRNPGHVHPEIWLHVRASAVLPLTCQRCLGPVDVPLSVERAAARRESAFGILTQLKPRDSEDK